MAYLLILLIRIILPCQPFIFASSSYFICILSTHRMFSKMVAPSASDEHSSSPISFAGMSGTCPPVIAYPLSQLQGGANMALDMGSTVQQTITPQDLDILVSRMVDLRLQQHQQQQEQHRQQLSSDKMSCVGQQASSNASHIEPIIKGGLTGPRDKVGD